MRLSRPSISAPRIWSLLAALATAVAVLAVPSPAWAEPPGCSHSVDFFTSATGDGYYMHSHASGSCSTSATRTLKVELKANLWPSDVVLASNTDNHTGTTFYTETHSCDGGQTKEYYGRSYYTQSVTWVDDGYVTVETCS